MDRYHRQQILLGAEAQARLGDAHAAVVGCGALGSVSAELLARAGVGTITLIDRDVVELTNLQRQLYTEQDVGRAKAEALAARLSGINSDIEVRPHVVDVSGSNILRLLDGADVALDGTDNFETRYVLNDLAVKLGTPYVYAGAIRTSAMMMVIAGDGPCLRCIFEEPPAPGSQPTCDTAGVLGGATAMIAARQAVEAMKAIVGAPLETGLLEFDVWTGTMRRIEPGPRRDDCPCCANRRFEFLDGERQGDAAALCGRNAVQVAAAEGRVDLDSLCARLQPHGSFEVQRSMLRGALRENEAVRLTVFHDGRAIVEGTRDVAAARALYARLIGT